MHADRPSSAPHRGIRRRGIALLMLSIAAVLLHAAFLSELDWTWPQRETPSHTTPRTSAALETRTVASTTTPTPPVPASPEASAKSEPAQPKATAQMTQSRSLPAPLPAPIAPVAATQRKPAADEKAARPAAAIAVESTAPDPQTAAPLQLALASTPRADPAPQPEAAASTGDETIPHYRTRMPGSATLRYQVSRGSLHGNGELQWRPQGDRYELKLESKLAGLTLLTQISSGGFDADGLAPERFTDTRIRRSTVAANFQREAGKDGAGSKDGGGKITFSGSPQELPLVPGVQDRVSWMVQLAAIVAAQPNLRVPGAKVVMQVVGANADASIWAFKCVGNETVDSELGPIAALKFVREPRGPYDTTAQAWLDPKHHFLPARATLRSGPNDEGYELHLQDVIGTP